MRDDLPDVDAIRASIREENLLGIGGFSSVYAIDGHPDYVVKIVHKHSGSELGNTIISDPTSVLFKEFKGVENPRFHGHNFGQPVAQYFKDGDVQILLRQKGIPCGVPAYLRVDPRHQLSKDELDRLYLQSLKRVSSIHQSGYTTLLEQIEFLTSIGFVIDASFSENLLVDETMDEFNLVDLTLKETEIVKPATGGDAIFSMMSGDSYIFDNPELELAGADLAERVLDKLLTAYETLNIQFMSTHPEDDFYLDGLNAPRSSQKRKDLVQRIQQTHGSNQNMPTKRAMGGFGLAARWRSLHPEVYGHDQRFTFEVPNGLKVILE